MSWLRSVRGRVVVAVLASLAVGVVLHALLSLRVLAVQAVSRLTDVYEPVSADVLGACPDSASTWHPQGREWEAFAYDGTTFRSEHPDAPPLLLTTKALLWVGMHETVAAEDPPWGGALIRRAELPPPCDVVLVRWKADEARRSRLVTVFGVSLLLVTLAASALTGLLAIRPLTRRLDAIAASARAVGTGAFASDDHGDDDLGLLAHTLREAHARLLADHEAERARRTVLEAHLADVAHDVRTPLASLQLRLEALAEEAPTEGIEAAIGDVVYLGLLTQNLHLAAQLQDADTRPAPDPIDLGEVVDRVVARFRVLGARRHVSVDGGRPDAPVWCRVEAVHAEQALANLVHNAVAHHDGGAPDGQDADRGHVAVVLTRSGSTFELTVADDGPGVASSDLPHLADRTFRSDAARARDGRGQGLGLAIVAALCAQAGWTLHIETGEPRGLVVRVSGTVAPPAAT